MIEIRNVDYGKNVESTVDYLCAEMVEVLAANSDKSDNSEFPSF